MKKLLSMFLALVMVFALTGCTKTSGSEDSDLKVVCTTYPVYLLTKAVTKDVQGVDLEVLVEQSISCIHDYSLSVTDMKKLESADVVIINGANFESFLDGIDFTSKTVINSSTGIALLNNDPHIWLDPHRAGEMAQNIGSELEKLHPSIFSGCTLAAEEYALELDELKASLAAQLEGISCRELITFHDGFTYFAAAFDLDILKAIEEESGSEASAAEVAEMISLVKEHSLPAIFTEVNGSSSTAQAIARETDAQVATLNMIISGDGLENEADPYAAAMTANVTAVAEAMK